MLMDVERPACIYIYIYVELNWERLKGAMKLKIMFMNNVEH